MNHRTETIDLIHRLQMPKASLSVLAGIAPSRLSDYIGGRHLPRATELRIEQTAANVRKVFEGLKVRIDISDTAGFKLALAHVNDLEAQRLEDARVAECIAAAQPIG